VTSGLRQTGPGLDELVGAVEAFDEHSGAAEVLAATGVRLVLRGFAEGRSPDGARWAPLRTPRPGGSVLVRTGALRSAVSAPTVRHDGFTLTSTSYGSFHQHGTRKMPARPFLPGERLPLSWESEMQRDLDRVLKVPA
jgi:phage gpG-like protein